MNSIYNLIWSKTKERWIVVSENVKGNGKVPFSQLRTIAVIAAMLSAGGPGYALDPGSLPTGGRITTGSGTISSSGNQMTVNQSTQQLIANWKAFNIGSDASVTFNQPGVTATALNRITDQNPTQIMGSLNSNGQVFLLNPSGIIFGKTAQVNVGGLVASSLNMLDSDFLAGKYNFNNAGNAGSIINQGAIKASNGGVVAFIAPKVTNIGSITANSGSALLAAGNQVSVDFTGDGLITYTVDQGAIEALVENKGLIKADGGVVVMTAKAVDALLTATVTNTGVIEARTIQNKAGRILLLSDMENGKTTVSGTLDASAPDCGDGGFVETSGAQVKIGDGTKVTTVSPQGKTGKWLIDPTDFNIGGANFDISGSTLSGNLNNSNQEILSSSGDINVNDVVSWSANTLTLSATNNININSALTATGTGSLTLTAGASATISATAPVNIGGIFNLTSGTWNQVTSTLPSFAANDFRITGGTFIRATGGDGTSSTPYLISDIYGLQGIGSSEMPNKSFSLAGTIDAIGTSAWNENAGFAPIETFKGTFDGLGKTISSLTINKSGGSNIGLFGDSSGLISNVGLVNASVIGGNSVGGLVGINRGTVGNCSVSDSYVKDEVRSQYLGGLAGLNSGSITLCSVSNTSVSGGAVTGVGGLVGGNDVSGIISGCSVSGGSVSGTFAGVGGLVGGNIGSITSSSVSNGNVSGGYYVGGLVGANGDPTGQFTTYNATISQSYATGSVSGIYSVGALVGENKGTETSGIAVISSDSYATSSVSGSVYVGGLVGYNDGGTIKLKYTLSDLIRTYQGSDYTLSDLWSASSIFGNSYSSWTAGTDYSFSYGGSTLSSFINAGNYSSISINVNKSGYLLEGSAANALGSLSITKAPLQVTAVDATKTYDGIAYGGGNGVSYSGFVHSENSGVLGGTLSYAGTSQSAINAASYLITPGGYTSGNYDISYIDGTLTISKAPLTVITGSLTGTISKVYDGTDVATLTSGNYLLNGFVSGEGASVTKASGTYDTANAGTSKTVTVSLAGSDYNAEGSTKLENYSLPSTVSGSIGTITQAPLQVTAVDATKTYDGIAYSGGNGVSYSGFVHSENSGVLGGTLSYAGTSQSAINAASYVITPGGYTSGNYDISNIDGTMTINKAHLTVSSDNQSRLYGSSNPIFTQTISGFVNGEGSSVVSGTATGSSSSDNTSGVGTYSILGSSAGLSASNYDFGSPVNGSLTINKAHLTVSSDNQSRLYGSSNPTFTETISGFVNGEGNSVVSGTATGSSAADSKTGVGSYVILGSASGLMAANYDFTTANGSLTINQAPLTVKTDNQNSLNASPNSPQNNPSGFSNAESGSVVSGSPLANNGSASGKSDAAGSAKDTSSSTPKSDGSSTAKGDVSGSTNSDASGTAKSSSSNSAKGDATGTAKSSSSKTAKTDAAGSPKGNSSSNGNTPYTGQGRMGMTNGMPGGFQNIPSGSMVESSSIIGISGSLSLSNGNPLPDNPLSAAPLPSRQQQRVSSRSKKSSSSGDAQSEPFALGAMGGMYLYTVLLMFKGRS